MGFFPVPTVRGLLLLFLAGVSTAVGIINAGFLTALIAAILVSAAVSAFLLAFCSLIGVSITREYLHGGVCGGKIPLQVTVKNHLPLYRHSCTLQEKCSFAVSGSCTLVIPPLAPFEKKILNYSVTAERRGEFFLENFYLCSGDPLGVFRKKRRFSAAGHLEIQPRSFVLESLENVVFRGGLPDFDGRNQGRAGKGPEFFGVRPYRIGDEIRHIHWKSTASQRKLMVKEFEAAAVDQIVILLDTEKRMTSAEPLDNNFEFLITCAASIAGYFGRKHCHLRFLAADAGEQLLHIAGDVASVKKKIMQSLTLMVNSRQKLETFLPAAIEHIPSRSIVFLLTMSVGSVPEQIRILEEQNSGCFWLYAPPGNFPPVEPDTPRIVRKDHVRKKLSSLDRMPVIADFSSGAEIFDEAVFYEEQ